MPSNVVFFGYAGAVIFAGFLMFWVGRARWYWHAISLAAAVAVLFIRPFGAMGGPSFDLAVGMAFTVLFLWGIGEPVYDALRLPHWR